MPSVHHQPGPRRRVTKGLALLTACGLTFSACGSRNDQNAATKKSAEPAPAAAAPQPANPTAEAPQAPTDSGSATPVPASQTPTAAPAAGSSTLAGSAPAPSSRSAAAGQSSASGAAAAKATSKPSATPAPGTGGGGSAPAAPTPAAPASPAASSGPKSEIVLGSFGQETGPLGALFAPGIAATKAWSAALNARGGVNGHKVRVLFADDGGDPSRSLGIVRNFVEKDHILAIVAEHGPVTVAAVLPYLEKVGVPRLGSVEGNKAVQYSPVSFQATVGGDKGTGWSHILPLSVFAPQVKKIYVIYCREIEACSNYNNRVKEFAPQIGLQVVGSSQSSIAQPDFTPEVLAAKDAGAQAIVVILENASAIRMARDVNRQGGGLILSNQQSMDAESFFKNGGKDVEGMLGGSSTAEFSTSAKMQEYRDAIDRYQPGAEKSSFAASAWAHGKLFEVAAAKLGDNLTPGGLIDALYSLHGETLGGIIPPITFPRDRSQDNINNCVVVGKVQGGKFVPKDNDPDKFTCPPGWNPAT
jgi:branched-chain amino acid transport system substrate-binding protein